MITPDRFYSVDELRKAAHAPRALVYDALRSGELRAFRRGRRWLIPGAAALAWLQKVAP